MSRYTRLFSADAERFGDPVESAGQDDGRRHLLKPVVSRVDATVDAGTLHLSWMSANLRPYLEASHHALDELEALMKGMADLISSRITSNLDLITEAVLMPEQDEPWETLQFVHETENYTAALAKILNGASRVIEVATDDLIAMASKEASNLLTGSRKQAEFMEAAAAFREHYRAATITALNACTQSTLGNLKRRCNSNVPFLAVRLVLEIPNITIAPTLDEVQTSINKVTSFVRNVSRSVCAWGQDHAASTQLCSVFAEVGDSKEVSKVVSGLDGTLRLKEPELLQAVAGLRKYGQLWETRASEKLKAFMATGPEIDDFQTTLQEYDAIEMSVNLIPGRLQVR